MSFDVRTIQNVIWCKNTRQNVTEVDIAIYSNDSSKDQSAKNPLQITLNKLETDSSQGHTQQENKEEAKLNVNHHR